MHFQPVDNLLINRLEVVGRKASTGWYFWSTCCQQVDNRLDKKFQPVERAPQQVDHHCWKQDSNSFQQVEIFSNLLSTGWQPVDFFLQLVGIAWSTCWRTLVNLLSTCWPWSTGWKLGVRVLKFIDLCTVPAHHLVAGDRKLTADV